MLLTPLFCLFVLFLAFSFFNFLAGFKQEPPRSDPSVRIYNVTAYRAEPADMQTLIFAFGTAKPDREVLLAAEVGGQIVETASLEVGTQVTGPNIGIGPEGRSSDATGDFLLRIDPRTYEERVRQADKLLKQDALELQQLDEEHAANQRLYDQAQTSLKVAQEEYDQNARLVAGGAGSKATLRQAELQLRQYEEAAIRLKKELDLYDVRKRQIESRRETHESDLAIAQLELTRSTVRAPFDGMISEVLVEQGQYVRPGEPLVQITDRRHIEVPLPIPLSEYSRVAVAIDAGRPPPVALAINETAPARWFGRVTRYSPLADEDTRTVLVYAEIDNAEQDVPLLPGAFVHGRIDDESLSDVILVPRDSVVDGEVYVITAGTEMESASPSIENADDDMLVGTVRRQPIDAGRALQSLVVVQEGVAEGDLLMLTNLDLLMGRDLTASPLTVRVPRVRSLAQELQRQRVPQLHVTDEAASAN